MKKVFLGGKTSNILISIFVVQLFLSLQNTAVYGSYSTGVGGVVDAAASIVQRGQRLAKLIAGLTVGVAKTFLDTPFDAPELSFGTKDLMITHTRSVDPGEGYVRSEAMVEPLSVWLVIELLMPYVPKPIQQYYYALQTFTPEQMFAIDFSLLLANVAKKRIPFGSFPMYANRMMEKISLTTEDYDIEQLATELTVARDYKGKQELLVAMKTAKKGSVFVEQIEAGKKLTDAVRLRVSRLSDVNYGLLINRIETGKSHFASEGPAPFYSRLPVFIRNVLDKIKFPVNTGIKEQVALFARSKVAPALWEIAAASRSKLKYSDRTAEAMTFVTVVQDKSREFTTNDLSALVYWARLHAGEWVNKVNQEDKEVVKKPLEEYLVALQKAIAERGYATAATDLQDAVTKVQQNQIPLTWCKLTFPEPTGVSKQMLKPNELIEHIWNSFLHLSNKDFISMYPFAAGSLGEVETDMMVQAIFQQHDRDVTASISAFKQADEGKELGQAVDAAQTAYGQSKLALKDATNDTYEELKTKYNDDLKAYFEAQQQLRKGASEFAYVTPEEEMMAFLESRKTEPLSAMNRMMRRFRELQEMSQSRDKFSKAIRSNAPLLVALGFNLDEFFDKFASVSVDRGKSYMRPKFVLEKEDLNAIAVDADTPASATPEGAAEPTAEATGDFTIDDSAAEQDAAPVAESRPQTTSIEQRPDKSLPEQSAQSVPHAQAHQEVPQPSGNESQEPAEQPAQSDYQPQESADQSAAYNNEPQEPAA